MSDTRADATGLTSIELAPIDLAPADLTQTGLIDDNIDDDIDDDLLDFVSDDDDRTFPERPCGDPAMHDRLLALLRRHHPGGHENVVEPNSRRLPWRVTAVEKSLTGCSASLCADAA